MRLLYVINDLGVGGAQTQLSLLLAEFEAMGHECLVVSMLGLDHPAHVMTERWESFATASLQMRKGRPDPRAITRLRRIQREFGPDLVHAFLAEASILARLARGRAPLISSARNVLEEPRWKEWALRLTDPMTTLNVQVSERGRDRYLKDRICWARPITVIPNGIHLADERAGGGPRDWLFLGRLSSQKRIPLLLDAYRILQRQDPSPERSLTVVGGGPDADHVRAAAALDPSIRAVGEVQDPGHYLDTAGAIVMTSWYEGFPNVLLEGLSRGIPFVATHAGDEHLLDNEYSTVLPSDATADSVATAMARLEATTAEAGRAQVSEATRQVARVFDLTNTAATWAELYIDNTRDGRD